MEHGTHGFFIERSRCARRVVTIAVVLSVIGIAFLSYLPLMTSTTATEQFFREAPILRFGYEGTEQYVRRIELKAAPGIVSDEEGLQAVYLPPSRQGGSTRSRRTQHQSAPPVSRPPRPIEGEGDVDRMARALAARENVPLVQSQDLIIERQGNRRQGRGAGAGRHAGRDLARPGDGLGSRRAARASGGRGGVEVQVQALSRRR